MVHLGMCEDEGGHLVLDGVLAIAAGARMTEANWRFGQPSAQGPKSAVFPFTDATQVDPVSGQTDGLLRRALQRGKVPRCKIGTTPVWTTVTVAASTPCST